MRNNLRLILPILSLVLAFAFSAFGQGTTGNIEGTDKVYTATWAALLAIQAHNQSDPRKIAVAALPAMGTGFGGVPFDEAARQMAVAYRHLLEPPHRLDWDFVAERQRAVCYDGGKQVVR